MKIQIKLHGILCIRAYRKLHWYEYCKFINTFSLCIFFTINSIIVVYTFWGCRQVKYIPYSVII